MEVAGSVVGGTAMVESTASAGNDVIRAAGGVICRQTSSSDEILIVRRRGYEDWTLPKEKEPNAVIATRLRLLIPFSA
jgi:hypothetical protein